MKRDANGIRDDSPEYRLGATRPAVPLGYKQTELGVIPEDWEFRPLEEISRGIFRGASPRPIGDQRWFADNSDIGWVRISDVTRSRRHLLSTTQKLSEEGIRRSRFIPSGSLIMSICATVGRPIETAVDTCIHDGFVVFERPSVDQGFLYHHLVDLEPRWAEKGQTGSQMNLNTSLIKRTEVPVPPTGKEQRAIATALSDVDALLEELDRLIAKKRDLKQAAMQQLLTGQTRLPGFEGEWIEQPLQEIAEIRSGGTPSTNNATFWNGGVAWCTPTDITALRGRKYLGDTERTISNAGLRASSAEVIPPNSVIMTTRATIGECAINTRPMTTNQGFKNLVPFAADAEFLYYLMTTQKERLIQLCGGSTFLEIGKKQLQRLEISLPLDTDEQAAIAKILADMDAGIEALEQRRTKTAALKQAMMQELLTGKTRLVEPAMQDQPAEKGLPSARRANVYFMRSVLAAEIVEQLHEEATFGHVKFEKMLFLVEHLCDVETGSTYHRKAAGPYDNQALRSIDSQLQKHQWFEARKEDGRYWYAPLDRRGNHKTYFDRYFAEVSARFQQVLDTFRHMDTERCEIVATLFAAWRDLLRDQPTVSDEMIVHEVLNNWHESKQRIPEDRWLKALTWMREQGFVPNEAASS